LPRRAVAATSAVTLIAVAGRGGGDASSTAASGPIKVGVSLPSPPRSAASGSPRNRAPSWRPSRSTAPADGQSSFQALVDAGVVAATGGMCSDATLPALTVMQRARVPVLVDTASNP
jgi:hypothetical protein